MRVLSLFSGVGGMDLGLERSGMQVVGMCEIDKHARSVLAHHWPDVPIHDDVTTLETEQWRGRVDLVAGGSPCQDLSVAGRRKGLDGGRSGLFWHQCRIADQSSAPWVLWENVAGALTSNNGADFAAVLWGITGTHPRVPDGGWRSAGVVVGPKRSAVWRLLDAQYFAVAQRRRRVFVVGRSGEHPPPEILADDQGMPRNHAEDGLVTFYSTSGEQDRPSPDVANSLKAVSVMCVTSPDIAPRRLTPVECERLMSWPDDWTRYRDDGKEQADSHRYKQCGNGVVSNVAEWIGRRIMQAQQETTT